MTPRRRMGVLAIALTTAATAIGSNVAARAAPDGATAPASTAARSQARSDYIEYCAGCHGVTGSSRPAKVPVLRDRIGYFLCMPQGREYLIRLPNVANAAVESDAALAELMNYVFSEFGGASMVDQGGGYTAAEVAAWRREPLSRTSLVRFRSALVAKMRRQCRNIPATLEKFS